MSSDDVPDQDLVLRCRSNRAELQDSFRALYERHSGAVFHYLSALVGRERALDALQVLWVARGCFGEEAG